MTQNILAILFFCLVVGANASARLRGKHFESLEAMVRDPKIDAHIRGKTLKDLGIEQIVDIEEQARRKTQALVVEDENTVNMKFFTVSIIERHLRRLSEMEEAIATEADEDTDFFSLLLTSLLSSSQLLTDCTV